jgi:hypothetical protein
LPTPPFPDIIAYTLAILYPKSPELIHYSFSLFGCLKKLGFIYKHFYFLFLICSQEKVLYN